MVDMVEDLPYVVEERAHDRLVISAVPRGQRIVLANWLLLHLAARLAVWSECSYRSTRLHTPTPLVLRGEWISTINTTTVHHGRCQGLLYKHCCY